MDILQRYLFSSVSEDLKEKMVFLGGPRQVGKTTLALGFLDRPEFDHPAYFNWDHPETKARILRFELPADEKLIILDEVHKYGKWRALLKALFDTRKHKQALLVTGSARLDYYRKGGDSLVGRYFYYRLHPLTVNELALPKIEKGDTLLRLGGFPEPYLKGSERVWKRWQRQRIERVVYQDLRDLEQVKDVSLIDLLIEALPSRIGSPLSIANLAHDLEKNFRTIDRWLSILERIYLVFRISPFGSPKIRAVKKEQKLYFWDWSQCTNEGARFENFVASHLLKYCHFVEDTEGDHMELRFLRDTSKREVDFIVIKNKKPLFGVECKTGERALSPAIPYFLARSKIPFIYQVHLGTKDYQPHPHARILPFVRFSKKVGLV